MLQTGSVKHTVLTSHSPRENLEPRGLRASTRTQPGGHPGAHVTFHVLLNPDPTPSSTYTKTRACAPWPKAIPPAAYTRNQFEFSDQWKALLGVRYYQ